MMNFNLRDYFKCIYDLAWINVREILIVGLSNEYKSILIICEIKNENELHMIQQLISEEYELCHVINAKSNFCKK